MENYVEKTVKKVTQKYNKLLMRQNWQPEWCTKIIRFGKLMFMSHKGFTLGDLSLRGSCPYTQVEYVQSIFSALASNSRHFRRMPSFVSDTFVGIVFWLLSSLGGVSFVSSLGGGGGGASWLLLLDVVEDMDVVLLLRLREPVELFVLSAKHTRFIQALVHVPY